MSKRVVVIGGTFRPITDAHIEMGIQARKRFPDADIIYIPSNLEFISGWKEVVKDDIFGDKYRLELISNSIAPYGFSMNVMEAHGTTNGTTYESVLYLQSIGYTDIIWCIGYDKLNELGKWSHADELFKCVKFLVFSRNNKENNDIHTDFEVINLDTKFQEISSTKVRNAFKNNDFETIRSMVPDCVYKFLEEKIMKQFNAKKVKEELVNWLRIYFDNNGKPLNAVVGCSGGKDSSVVLAALVEAIGTKRVYPILMPNGEQSDINDSYRVCACLGLPPYVCNIKNAYDGILNSIGGNFNVSEQAKINLAPVIRMATLKAISQSIDGRFTSNGNLSETYIGWFTLDGDDRGAIKPLANLTATEVKAVGYELGLPKSFIDKTPTDGLCGMSDEEKFQFSYNVLDEYIRTGICENLEVKNKIDTMHKNNLFKLKPMPCFEYKA